VQSGPRWEDRETLEVGEPLHVGTMTTTLDTLPTIGAPAACGLLNPGYTTLAQLAGVRRNDLLQLPRVGPRAVRII